MNKYIKCGIAIFLVAVSVLFCYSYGYLRELTGDRTVFFNKQKQSIRSNFDDWMKTNIFESDIVHYSFSCMNCTQYKTTGIDSDNKNISLRIQCDLTVDKVNKNIHAEISNPIVQIGSEEQEYESATWPNTVDINFNGDIVTIDRNVGDSLFTETVTEKQYVNAITAIFFGDNSFLINGTCNEFINHVEKDEKNCYSTFRRLVNFDERIGELSSCMGLINSFGNQQCSVFMHGICMDYKFNRVSIPIFQIVRYFVGSDYPDVIQITSPDNVTSVYMTFYDD